MLVLQVEKALRRTEGRVMMAADYLFEKQAKKERRSRLGGGLLSFFGWGGGCRMIIGFGACPKNAWSCRCPLPNMSTREGAPQNPGFAPARITSSPSCCEAVLAACLHVRV